MSSDEAGRVVISITLENMFRYVPRSNDPGCSAGFGMGMVIYLGTKLVLDPRSVVPTCTRLPTRFREYTCIHGTGHALMRGYHGQLAGAVLACTQARPEIRARLLAGCISRLLDLARRRRRNDAAARTPTHRRGPSAARRDSCARAGTASSGNAGPRYACTTRRTSHACAAPWRECSGPDAWPERRFPCLERASRSTTPAPAASSKEPTRSTASAVSSSLRSPASRASSVDSSARVATFPEGGHVGVLLLVRPHALGRHGRSVPCDTAVATSTRPTRVTRASPERRECATRSPRSPDEPGLTPALQHRLHHHHRAAAVSVECTPVGDDLLHLVLPIGPASGSETAAHHAWTHDHDVEPGTRAAGRSPRPRSRRLPRVPRARGRGRRRGGGRGSRARSAREARCAAAS